MTMVTMRWTERQRRMLQEMGIVLWAPQAQAAASPAAPAVAAPAEAVPATPAAPAAPPRPGRIEAPAVAPSPTLAADDSRAISIRSMDWDSLRHAVAGCSACGLCRGRRQAVFGVGHPRAHWMIVGEAPGEQEDLKGEPFVGPAGRLLDNMLRALALTRAEASPEQQVYIADTLKCRPPRNRNPEPSEMAACEPFLQRQIELVRPKLILAMGRFAVQALLRSDQPIGKLRGSVHRCQGVPLVVTYHPAYLLRSLADKAKAWDDLCLAASVAESAAVAGNGG
jgi:uracil-DNA glycosylase